MKKIFIKSIITAFIALGFINSKVQAVEVDYIQGSDRYETASLIADKIDYQNVILVNGLSIADGLSASGLSGALNAPILLTRDTTIPNSTLEKLHKAANIYIVGGNTVISPNLEKELIKLGKSVKRLAGDNRYDTSIAVAKEIESIKGVQEIYYVNGIKGQADAMSIAPVAASRKNPVILTNGLDSSYKKNIKSYSIGGTTVLSTSFDAFSERISGLNKFETNKNVINKFFPNKTHVNLSKSDVLIDALTSSALKEPVVLVSAASDKSVISGAKSITVFGDIDAIAVRRAKAYLYGDTVVFYSQHQDDETLFAGSAIVDAIQAVGKENVYIVLITDGTGSEVFKWSRYKNIPTETKINLRNTEFLSAVSKLGILPENIVMLGQPENNINEDVISDAVTYFQNSFPNVTHVVHSYKYDTHPQHLATGKLIYELYKNNLIYDCRFFIPPSEASYVPNELLIESTADNNLEKESVLNAVEEYKLDNQDMIREGIGFKSVPGLFKYISSDPKVSSYLHMPEN